MMMMMCCKQVDPFLNKEKPLQSFLVPFFHEVKKKRAFRHVFKMVQLPSTSLSTISGKVFVSLCLLFLFHSGISVVTYKRLVTERYGDLPPGVQSVPKDVLIELGLSMFFICVGVYLLTDNITPIDIAEDPLESIKSLFSSKLDFAPVQQLSLQADKVVKEKANGLADALLHSILDDAMKNTKKKSHGKSLNDVKLNSKSRGGNSKSSLISAVNSNHDEVEEDDEDIIVEEAASSTLRKRL